MLRSCFIALLVLSTPVGGPLRLLRAGAQQDWIRAGSYVEWPDSLCESPPDDWENDWQPIAAASVDDWTTETDASPVVLGQPVAWEWAEAAEISPSAPRVATYGWQVLPEGLLYHSYLAGEKEPRFAAQWLWEKERGLVWEAALGGRWGLFRKGTYGPDGEGFQFDVEGAGLARVDPQADSDLEAADFRAGFIGTWRRGAWRLKTGYYHLSSHVGDEYLIRNPTYVRRNYVRDSLLVGMMYDFTPDLQLYGEVASALNANGGAEAGELQFGAQYSPIRATGFRGAPFAAINGHLRQEFDFDGSVNVEAGWQWRGAQSGNLFRAGLQHYRGPSIQYSFFDRYESLTGMGIWFDF